MDSDDCHKELAVYKKALEMATASIQKMLPSDQLQIDWYSLAQSELQSREADEVKARLEKFWVPTSMPVDQVVKTLEKYENELNPNKLEYPE